MSWSSTGRCSMTSRNCLPSNGSDAKRVEHALDELAGGGDLALVASAAFGDPLPVGADPGTGAAARELVECVFYALRVGPVRRQAVPARHRTTSSARPAHRDPSAGPGHGRSSSRSPAQPLAHLCRPRPTFEIGASRVPSGLNASPFTGATAAPLAVATTPTSIATIRGSST